MNRREPQTNRARPSVRRYRRLLEPFLVAGGLFDVEPCALDLDVGRRCRFIKARFPYQRDTFTIVDVQLDCRGIVCYRVAGDHETCVVGALAHPETVYFVDDKPEFNGGLG